MWWGRICGGGSVCCGGKRCNGGVCCEGGYVVGECVVKRGKRERERQLRLRWF